MTIGAADRAASRAFYATVLPALGVAPLDDPAYVEWLDFSIAQAGAGRAVTTGLHVGFAAPGGTAQVEAFWRAGVDAGYRDDGAPGPRPQYAPDDVDAVAPHAGFRLVEASPGLVRYSPGPRRGSLTLLEGEPTSPVHLAFPAPDPAAVASFHRALTAAGHSDNGGPGERPEYHPGYVGAFVLDPDGHDVELVHHGPRRH